MFRKLMLLLVLGCAGSASGQFRPTGASLDIVNELKRWENAPFAKGSYVDKARYDRLGQVGEIGFGFSKNGLEDAKRYGVAPKHWKMPPRMTGKQAHVFLTTVMLPTYGRMVDKVVTVPLTPGQRNALIMFAYNLGETNLRKLVSGKGRLNSGNYGSVPRLMLLYVNTKTKKGVNGLLARRKREAQIWNRG